jgi:hypothetical protein
MNKPHPQANTLIRQEFKQNDRRFSGEAVTGFGPLLPTDSLPERMAAVWAPRIVETDEEANAINEAEDREAREEAYRDELLREKSDRLIDRYGRE